MTDVLILHRIPGLRPGQIVPLDDRLQKHVDAGNAKVLPNSHEAWNGAGDDGVEPQAPPVLQVSAMQADPELEAELDAIEDEDSDSEGD